MKVVVPTVWCEAMLTTTLSVAGKTFKPGELVKVSYGIALQGLRTGAFAAIKDEAAIHAQAIDHLATYGPDSWFPGPVQTITKLWGEIEKAQARKEAIA